MDTKNTLLFGNGINIQFGDKENSNREIILRAINETKQQDYPRHIIVDEPVLILQLLGYLYAQIGDILDHKYDQYAFTTDEKNSLNDFIERYEKWDSINLVDVGFEDYYLIYDLFCYKNKIYNPDKFYIREALKCFFLYSIYNHGKVEKIYYNYPNGLKEFFGQFQDIFTTNYDKNVEIFSGQKINYLHGSFYIKKDIYKPNSLRNSLSDRPINNCVIDDEHFYLYSNALTSYSGNSKLFIIKQAILANEGMDKFAKGYIEKPEIQQDVDMWKNDENILVKNLYETIKIKINNPDMKFDENYPIKEFEAIKGTLTIVGLSPNNDIHIFEMIDNNQKIKKIIFYYYEKSQIEDVKKLITHHKDILEFEEVQKLWKEYE
ncbi:hypothetical protein [Crassaminicella indica]|uniref:Uncharacterized protein n=1 Tax=Crassaminicella indica TaxID=2855394 RepID=A0ABX8RD18_9CLOT|nr:hypothetical protein [Crassaminicella indica]QXM06959.1 hypothetical protein KVH43_04365 [Crassaminicella indica]